MSEHLRDSLNVFTELFIVIEADGMLSIVLILFEGLTDVQHKFAFSVKAISEVFRPKN